MKPTYTKTHSLKTSPDNIVSFPTPTPIAPIAPITTGTISQVLAFVRAQGELQEDADLATLLGEPPDISEPTFESETPLFGGTSYEENGEGYTGVWIGEGRDWELLLYEGENHRPVDYEEGLDDIPYRFEAMEDEDGCLPAAVSS